MQTGKSVLLRRGLELPLILKQCGFVDEKFRPISRELESEVIAAGWFAPAVAYGFFPARPKATISLSTSPRVTKARMSCGPVVRCRTTFARLSDSLCPGSAKADGSLSAIISCRAHPDVSMSSACRWSLSDQGLRSKRSGCSRRVSACPNLEDQTKLFALLKPEEAIGVRPTSTYLIEPEQSTSAIIESWDRSRPSLRRRSILFDRSHLAAAPPGLRATGRRSSGV